MPRRLGTVAVCAALWCFLLAAPARSEGEVDWDFEGPSFAGWITSNAVLAVDSRAAAGQQAVLITPASPLVRSAIESKYWLTPAEPGYRYTVTAAIRASAGWEPLALALEFFDTTEGSSGESAPEFYPANTAPLEDYTTLTTQALAPPGTAFLSVSIEGIALAAGAELLLDHVVVTAALEVTPAATATPGPTPTPTPLATPSPTPTATVRPTPTATPSRTPTPAPTPAIFGRLTNGDFDDPDDPLYGWSAVGGLAASTTWRGGRGESAQLLSTSSGTKWLQQAVVVVGSSWYEASAMVGVDSGSEAWLRLAWYESSDASGAQLATADSSAATGAVERVSVGPVQAPPAARSARVRLMLRPASSAAVVLVADDVMLRSTAAPTHADGVARSLGHARARGGRHAVAGALGHTGDTS